MRTTCLIVALLLAGCAVRDSEEQMGFLLDELTIVREELKKYPQEIRALELQVRGQRRILHEEIRALRQQVARLEQRLQLQGATPTSQPAGDGTLIDPYLSEPGKIKRIGPDHWRVSRSSLARTNLLRAARIVPAIKGGKPEGFKLFAIRPGSVFWNMGFKNGDTILAINGKALTSPDRALRVYTRLRGTRKVKVSIRRRGQRRTLRYTLVP